MTRPRIVVVGAGFGGLATVRALKGAPVAITLLDRNNYHLFTPLLYQVASSLLNPSDIAHPVRAILRGRRNVAFRVAEVTALDLEDRAVVTASGERIPYDYLVVAPGTVTNFFGNDAIEASAHGLKTLPEGLELRNHILSRFEAAAWEPDAGERAALLTFVVVGGGPTGVEYAGALSELFALVQKRDFPSIDFREVRVVLVEGDERVLGTFDAKLGVAAGRNLAGKGVELRLGVHVSGYDGTTVQLSDGETIRAATVVWAAGVKGSPLGSLLTASPARGARVPVRSTLQLEGRDEVFVVGDLAGLEQDGRLVPQLAEVAQGQGKCAAGNILRLQEGERPVAYRYRSRGIMATIGRNNAVAEVAGLKLTGFAGWLTWLFVHLVLLIGFRRRLFVLLSWAWDYVFYDRPVRLIAVAREARKHPAAPHPPG